MKICALNYASGSWYPTGQARLGKTLKQFGFPGDFVIFNSCAQIPGCPEHSAVPYAFKPYLLHLALKSTYSLAFWFDASVYLIRPMDRVIERVQQYGCYFEEESHMLGEWCSDAALKAMCLTREAAWKIPLLRAGCFGLDLNYEIAQKFIYRWLALAQDGITFHGSWTNAKHECSNDPRVKGHRHDMAAASAIAHQLDMPLLPNGSFAAYADRSFAADKQIVFNLYSA